MRQIANFGGSSTSTAKDVLSKVKTSRESVTSSTTLQDDNDFSFSLKANTTYAITGTLIVNAPATGGFKLASNVTSGLDHQFSISGYNNSSFTLSGDLLNGVSTSSQIQVGAADANFKLTGFITTSSSAITLTFQWSQHTSNATATYIERGSTMILTEV